MHTPVLLQKAIEGLNVVAGGRYIDATAGEGGHTQLILEKGGKVLAIDWDETQVESLKSKIESENVQFAVGNFAEIADIAQKQNFAPVDGVLFDFGLSMKQLTDSGKGLSYKKHEQLLDMRIDLNLETTAGDIINSYSEEELYETFAQNAEEFHSLSIAESIVLARVKHRIETVGGLLAAIDFAIKKCTMSHRHGDDVYARIFQALRIEVNHEFDNMRKGIVGALEIVKVKGRILTISFHSLEDRLIKNFIKTNQHVVQIHKHTIHGDRRLRFERSAKLRIIERIS